MTDMWARLKAYSIEVVEFREEQGAAGLCYMFLRVPHVWRRLVIVLFLYTPVLSAMFTASGGRSVFSGGHTRAEYISRYLHSRLTRAYNILFRGIPL